MGDAEEGLVPHPSNPVGPADEVRTGQKVFCWRPVGSRSGSWLSSCAMLAFSAPTFLGL